MEKTLKPKMEQMANKYGLPLPQTVAPLTTIATVRTTNTLVRALLAAIKSAIPPPPAPSHHLLGKEPSFLLGRKFPMTSNEWENFSFLNHLPTALGQI
jgi:hypothetical protein